MGRVSTEGSYQPAYPSQQTQNARKMMDHFEGWIILRGRGGGKVKGSIDLDVPGGFPEGSAVSGQKKVRAQRTEV